MGILHNLTGWHAIILFAVVLLFFGASKLPALARSVGQSVTIFKTEVKDTSARTTESTTLGDPGVDTDARLVSTPHPPTVINAVTAPDEHTPVANIR